MVVALGTDLYSSHLHHRTYLLQMCFNLVLYTLTSSFIKSEQLSSEASQKIRKYFERRKISLLKLSGSMCITCFNMPKLCILATGYICVFHMFLTINSDFFLKQHKVVGRCSGDVMIFLWSTNWIIYIYILQYLEEIHSFWGYEKRANYELRNK
jgi:hypothetical protein